MRSLEAGGEPTKAYTYQRQGLTRPRPDESPKKGERNHWQSLKRPKPDLWESLTFFFSSQKNDLQSSASDWAHGA